MNLSIKYAGMAQTGTELGEAVRTVAVCRRDVEKIKNRCRLSGASGKSIIRSLNFILEEMDTEANLLGTLRETLERAGRLYQDCENRVADAHGQGKRTPEEDGENSGTQESGESLIGWSDLWAFVGKAGIAGSVVSMAGNLITGEDTEKSLISSGKFLSHAIGGGADAVRAGGTSSNWRDFIFGMNNALKKVDTASPGRTFVSSIKKQWDDLVSPELATTADKVKVGAKWFGNILTLAGNAIDNIKEMEEEGISAGRATAETIVETGVDIGMGMAATALVSSAAVALGFTAAPAVVIGIGAVGVTWAVNSVCEWVTGGKDVAEVTADLVCDIGEGAVSLVRGIGEAAGEAANAVGKAVNAVGEAAEAAGNAICNGVSAAWNGLCGLFA